MASKRGMFTSTFLNVSKISLSTSSIFLLGMTLGGKRRGMEGASVCSGATIEVEGVRVTPDVEGPATWASRFLWSVAGSSSFSGADWGMGTLIFFLDLNELALTFLGFSIVCDNSLSEFWACHLPIICPIWFVRLWIEALVSCWNCIFWRVIILTNSSNEVEDQGAVGARVAAGISGTGATCVGTTLC